MIAKKNMKPCKRLLGLFGASALACASASAQNLRDDVALVDQMIEVKGQIDLTKELSIHLRLMKDAYSGSVYSLQEAKIAYVSGRKTQARQAFSSIKSDDSAFEEMVFSYFKYASKTDVKDSTGKKEAATLYFESQLVNKVPVGQDPKRNLLYDMVVVYTKIVRSDEKKMTALKAWGDKHGFEIIDAPPIQEFIDANDAAEKIVLQDKGVDPAAKLDVENLEKFIAAQIKAEWDKMDYWFFKGVIERARAYALIGQDEKALSTLAKFNEKFVKMDEEVRATIMGDPKISKSEKARMIPAASFKAGIRYVKGLSYLIQAKKLKKKGSDDAAREKLIGRTGAAVQFFLCSAKNRGSGEAFKSIIRYGNCRDFSSKWFDKNLKALSVSPMEQGKAYYSIGHYDKAIENFAQFKTKAASKEGYEAMYLIIPSLVKSDRLDEVDEYLDILKGKYRSYNKAPNAYYTKMCLYLSGVYKTKMEEAKSDEEKSKFDQIRTDYYKRTLDFGEGNAPVAYALANKEFSLVFKLTEQKKKAEAKTQYLKTIKTYEALVVKYSSSLEAVKAYKKMAQLHEYFKDLEKAAANYKAYSDRLATPDLAGKIDKATIIMGIANIYFQKMNYSKTSESLKDLKAYMAKEGLKSSEPKQKKTIDTLRENSSLLNLFVADKLSVPAKKELRDLKNELKEKEGDQELEVKIAKAEKDLNKKMMLMVTSFDEWISRYNSSVQVPNVMARLGGLYQELNNSKKAKSTYEKLRRTYPDHPVVKQISLNIVKVHLDNDDIESAAIAVKDAKVEELDKGSLRYLIGAFLVEEVPAGMNKETLKSCSEVVLRASTALVGIYTKAKADLNQIHWVQYRKARALYNLGKLEESKVILEKAATEKKLGPYIFDIKFLLGAIASQQNDFAQVQSIYSKLMGLDMRMPADLNRSVRIRTEWASAYLNVDKPELVKKGRGLAMLSKDTNIDALDEKGAQMVQKAFYLFVVFEKKMGEDITASRKEFLKRFPTSPYALTVRKL
jgi:tetratricopeptide (TPR) repeat protein